MGSDFSALDAELDTLGVGPVADALSLAVSYAGNLAALSDIDAALGELDADAASTERLASSLPSPAQAPRASTSRASMRDRESQEIALPDPILRSRAETRGSAPRSSPHDADDQSGELTLQGKTPQSGSFSLDDEGFLPENRDDTLETTEEELAEVDVDLLDLHVEAPPVPDAARDPSRASVRSRAEEPRRASVRSRAEEPPASTLFARDSSRGAADGNHARDDSAAQAAQEESDAAFAELFADATRQSGMPAPRHSHPPPAYEDTEVFDTGGLGYVENLQQGAALADTVGAEELDSAEFEIVMDDDMRASPPPSVPPPHPSQPPEKRPSFLGRLFGRKEE